MKIFYINVINNNAHWGAEWFMNQAFIKNEIETINIDYRKNKYNLCGEFLKIDKDFDFLLLQRGEGFPLELLESVKRPKFFWASELVSRRRDQDRLFKSGLFDHIFVRSVDCVEKVIDEGWLTRDKVSILLSSFDPNIYKKIETKEKDIDVLFVGSLTTRRKVILDELNKKFNIKIASAYASEANVLYNRSRIVLNIHSEEFLDTETRIFEVLGSGAFLITEKLSKENPFIDKTHLIEVADTNEMEEKIKEFLNNPNAREFVAEAGRLEALRAHTFNHRAKEIIDVFSVININKTKATNPLDIVVIERYAHKEKILFYLYKIYFPLFRVKRKIAKILNL